MAGTGTAGLNKVGKKDDAGFTPQERHDIILATLAEFGKGSEAFQLRWRENSGELLTGEILLKTPMFWFMKYKWSRHEIETVFYKARVVIDERFDRALQQTFGGDPGPRWKGGGGVKKKNWKRVDDVTMGHDVDEKEKKNDKEYHGLIAGPDPYKFNYNPVVQPVDFQATGGIPKKEKEPTPPPDYSKWREPTGDNIVTLNIQCPDGKTMKCRVKLDEPLHYLKKQIQDKGKEAGADYPEDKQKLFFNNAELLGNDASLQSYGLKDGDTLQLSMGPIKVWVVKKDGTKLQIMVDPHASIAKCKKEIESNTYPSIPANEQMLYKTAERDKAPDNEFDDNYRTLFQYGVKDGDYMYLGGPTVWRAPKGDDAYPIYVECPDGRTLTLNVTSKDDVEYTKLQIQTLTNGKYPVSAQRLWFKNPETGNPKELTNNNATLGDEKIKRGALLKLGPIPISVETREGKIFSLMVSPYERVADLKQIIEDKTKEQGPVYPAKEQQLYNKAGDVELVEGASKQQTIADFGVVANSELYLGGTIPVKIRKTDGSIFTVNVDPTKPCSSIKQLIQEKDGMPVKQQTLYFRNTELNDTRPVKSYNIKKNDIIDLKQTFPITIHQPHGQPIVLQVSPDDTVQSIKQRVEDKTSPTIPVKAQTLSFKNKELDQDGAPISKYGIVADSELVLSIDNDDPNALLEKILSRQAPQQERIDAMKKIHANVGKNKKYDVLLAKDKVPLLCCGYAVQVLDDDQRQPVSQTAIEMIADINKTAMDKDNDAAMGALDETLDSLFKIYDDPKLRKLHPYAKKAINRIVDDIVARNDPKSINQLVEKLGEKVDTQNINTPEVRQFAMRQLQKCMFPEHNKLMNKIFADGAKMKELPDVNESDLEPPTSSARNWFDVAIDDKVGPTKQIGDRHRDAVARAIGEMMTDPNRDNKQIGINLADLFSKKDRDKFRNRLDDDGKIAFDWKFRPLKPWEMKMPPKGPQKKYKVDPLQPVDYKIKQKTELTIGAAELPDL